MWGSVYLPEKDFSIAVKRGIPGLLMHRNNAERAVHDALMRENLRTLFIALSILLPCIAFFLGAFFWWPQQTLEDLEGKT